MLSKEIPVKLSRVIVLFGIASTSIIALAILFVAYEAAVPTFDAIGWHLRNGGKVTFDGRTFHVPLMWHCTSEPYRNALEIDQAYGGGTIDLTATGQKLDSAAARAWQAKTIADFNNKEKYPLLKESGRILEGKTLEFVCVSTDFVTHQADFLDCRISNTDLRASIIYASKYHDQVASILDLNK